MKNTQKHLDSLPPGTKLQCFLDLSLSGGTNHYANVELVPKIVD